MKKSGFTLAEVLITLGIIGVVSALTIPTLVKRNTNETHVQQLKKFYATLSQAVDTAMAENSTNTLKETMLGVPESASAAQSKAAVNSFLNEYFKVAVDCDSTPTPCFADSYKRLDGEDFVLANAKSTYIVSGDAGKCVSLADGTAVCLWSAIKPTYSIWYGSGNYHDMTQLHVDVNGAKGPNILGRDLFALELYSDGKIGDHYDASQLTYFGKDTLLERCSETVYTGAGCLSVIILDGWKMDY